MAVATSAFVGAGIVALGAASNLPDAKAISPTVLADLENASVTANGLAERSADADRASRDSDRASRDSDRAVLKGAAPQAARADAWLLPLKQYRFTAPFGVRFGKLHAGIDLAALEGTPYTAVAGGVVTKAGYNGGYGYAVTVRHPDGTETIYAHSRKLFVHAGQTVKAGDVLGEVGATGYAYGAHLHLEVHENGTPIDPVRALLAHGADVKLGVESVYGDLAAS